MELSSFNDEERDSLANTHSDMEEDVDRQVTL